MRPVKNRPMYRKHEKSGRRSWLIPSRRAAPDASVLNSSPFCLPSDHLHHNRRQ